MLHSRGSEVVPSMEPAREFRLGVLLVHGIGTQPWGDTLVRWGDTLIQTITRATSPSVLAIVERAGPHETQATGTSAEARLRIETSDGSERWLLREAWWAESFPSPTYRELVSWSLRALPWAVALHFARGYWRDEAAAQARLGTPLAFLRAGGKLLVMLLVTPVVMLLMGLALVLGVLPPLRGWVLAVQSALTSAMGDTLAFVESPLRAALIRTRILEQVTELAAHCDRTIVVAHSQGAAAVLDALGGIADGAATQRRSPRVSGRPVPDTLVTFGAGINQLVSLRVVSGGQLPDLKGGSAYSVMAFALTVAAAATWLAWRVWSHQTTVPAILLAQAFVAVGFFATIGVAAALQVGIVSAARRSPRLQRHQESVSLGMFLATLVGFGGVMSEAEIRGVDVDSAVLPLLALVMLLTSTSNLLSKRLEHSVKEPVLSPPDLARWIDLHASADPVPNGATATRETGMPEDVPIWNRGSILSDHTTYWENLDGFVLRIVGACAATARSSWASALSHDLSEIDARARWRVGFLRLARTSTLALWVALGALLFWTGRDSQIPVPSAFPTWIPGAAARPAVLTLLLLGGAWASYTLVFAVWHAWAQSEQRATLAHQSVTSRGIVPLTGIGLVVWMLALITFGLTWNVFIDEGLTFAAYQLPFVVAFSSVVPTALSVLVLQWLKPPPSVRVSTRVPAAPPVQTV